MRLSTALRVAAGDIVSFVGAGGKSSTIRTLTKEHSESGRVIVTTTTNIGLDQTNLAAFHLVLNSQSDLARIPDLFRDTKSILLTGPANEPRTKWTGLGREQINKILEITESIEALLLIEADGARKRSLKVPAEHEPPIHESSSLVVPVAGLDVLETTIAGKLVHRPELAEELLEIDELGRLSEDDFIRILASKHGGLKNIPSDAEVRVLLNKVHSSKRAKEGRAIAGGLLRNPDIRACLLGEVQDEGSPVFEVHGRIAGVILAAGEARRMGQIKQLLEWRNKPMLWHSIQAARSSGLSPLVVVIGSHGNQIQESLKFEDVIWVHNPQWQSGQSTSLIAGLEVVADLSEAVVFLLADMPFIPPSLLDALKEKHRHSLAPIVAPRSAGLRANPVLFDRSAYSSLAQLKGEWGGRRLFEIYPPTWVDWDENVFMDIDTPEDLKKLETP